MGGNSFVSKIFSGIGKTFFGSPGTKALPAPVPQKQELDDLKKTEKSSFEKDEQEKKKRQQALIAANAKQSSGLRVGDTSSPDVTRSNLLGL